MSDKQARGAKVSDKTLDALVERLQAMTDNAYCEYIGRLRRDECLGWEIKTERGLFREPELKVHRAAEESLGRHRALSEAAALVRELLTPNAGVNPSSEAASG